MLAIIPVNSMSVTSRVEPSACRSQQSSVPGIQNETARAAVQAVNKLGKEAREGPIHFRCIHSGDYYSDPRGMTVRS